MEIKTLKDLSDIKGKTVILRTDFNVPQNENGEVSDATRITESIPTIKQLIEKRAKIVIISHLGRPNKENIEKLSLKPIAKELERLLGQKVEFTNAKIDKILQLQIQKLPESEILMLENIRFYKEEEENDPTFSKNLAALGDYYVNDAFATAHRAHASTSGITNFIPSYAGLLMQKEIEKLSPLLEKPLQGPVVIILGGAKIDTKIGLIKNFIDKADFFILGGGLANTFLAAKGEKIGNSLFEQNKTPFANELIQEINSAKKQIILPEDAIIAKTVNEISATRISATLGDIQNDEKILDIGPASIKNYSSIIESAGTIIWNGPLGVCEFTPFQNGTKKIAQAIISHKNISIVGGGDTIDALNKIEIPLHKFSHVSTGGGASIEFLEGKNLPGIVALKK